MFKNAKMGDKLYSVEEWRVILEAITDSDYPLIMQFEWQGVSFTIDDKRYEYSKYYR